MKGPAWPCPAPASFLAKCLCPCLLMVLLSQSLAEILHRFKDLSIPLSPMFNIAPGLGACGISPSNAAWCRICGLGPRQLMLAVAQAILNLGEGGCAGGLFEVVQDFFHPLYSAWPALVLEKEAATDARTGGRAGRSRPPRPRRRVLAADGQLCICGHAFGNKATTRLCWHTEASGEVIWEQRPDRWYGRHRPSSRHWRRRSWWRW